MKISIYKIILLAVCILTGSSCVDLSQEPKSFLSEEDYFAIDGAAEKSVPGLYWKLWKGNYAFNCRLMRLNVQADDITVSPTKPGNLLNNIANLSPALMANNPDFSSLWENFMEVICESNRLIAYTPIANDNSKKTLKVKAIVGEAYFMRALAYLYTVRIFGDAPMLIHPKEAAVDMPRESVESIYTKMIVPSLERAMEWLPEVSRTGDSGSPTKWAAKACLADAYMSMAGWPLHKTECYEKAMNLSLEIINSNRYELMDDYASLWKEENKADPREFIFTLQHSVANKVPSQYGKSFYPIDFYPNAGWADYYGDLEFFNSYPNDDRKKWNYMTEWQVQDPVTKEGRIISYTESNDKLPAISKYYDYDNGQPSKSQLSNGVTSIYRYADVLLTYAEASVLAKGIVDDLALECLNKVQNRANSIVTLTKDAKEFEEAVFNEKGWEFFAEMRRWFDLVRKEKVGAVRPQVWNNSFYKAQGHYYFPIPQGEIDLTNWNNNKGY